MINIKSKNVYFLFLCIYIFIITIFPKANSTAWTIFIFLPSIYQIKNKGYKKTGFELPVIIFFIASLISLIGVPSEYIKFSTGELKKVFKFLSLILLIPQMLDIFSEKEKEILNKIFLTISCIFVILVYFQTKGIYLNYDYKYYDRITGGYQLSSYSGILMVINLYYLRDICITKKYIEKIIFGITLLLMILTNSRGIWLGSLLVYGLYILLEKRKHLIKIFLVGIVMSIVLWNINSPVIEGYRNRLVSITDIKKNGSNLGRLDMWKKAVPIIKENPIKGVGYRNGGKKVVDYFNPNKTGIVHFHNMLIEMFTGVGIIGVISYLFIYLSIISSIEKLKKSIGNESYKYLYPLLGVFVYDNFEPVWIRGNVYYLLFALIGIMYFMKMKGEK